MLRMMAACSICFANFGKCSLIWMPETEVGIGLNSRASLVPGLRSKVSLWVGPPSIHSRMHDLCLAPVCAACEASTFIQPDSAGARTPAEDSLKKSRRDRPEVGSQFSMGGFLCRSQESGI